MSSNPAAVGAEVPLFHEVEGNGDQDAEEDHVGQQRRDDARIERGDADERGIDHRARKRAADGQSRPTTSTQVTTRSAGSVQAGVPACAAKESAARSAAGIAARSSVPDGSMRLSGSRWVLLGRRNHPSARPMSPTGMFTRKIESPASETGQDPAERRTDAEPHRLRRTLDTEAGAEPRRRQHVANERVGVRLQHHCAHGLDEACDHEQAQ